MKKILIVEDEPRIRSIYSQLLATCGVKVVEACDAGEAEKKILSEKLDLILLDLHLPYIKGKDFFRVIQEHDPEMKIVIFSVASIEEQKKMAPQAADYFEKSRGSFILIEKVAKILF